MILRRASNVAVGDVIKHGPVVSWEVTAVRVRDDGTVRLVLRTRRCNQHEAPILEFVIPLLHDDMVEIVM